LPIRVKVLYFGQARDAAGTRAEFLSLPNFSSVGALVSESTRAHHLLKGISGSMRVAVNEEIAAEDRPLKDGDVVASLPSQVVDWPDAVSRA
jgi:molybdopterin converting factor small subunit